MLSKSNRATLVSGIMFCLALALSQASVQAHNPTPKPSQAVAPRSSLAGDIIYSQPPNPTGGLFASSWWDPNGSSFDMYVWDNFTLGSTQSITEIDWMGGYASGSGGPVLDFVVAIYPSIAAGTQPDISHFLKQYQTGGNAGETPAGMLGNVAMYNYHFVLPAPFQAAAGTTYWVQIYAFQNGSPDWGLTKGTGGEGSHFLEYYYDPSWRYQSVPGDVTFTLLGPAVPVANLSATNDSPTALGQTTTFTATVDSGSNVSYQWNLGDGALKSGSVVTHTYSAIGFYTAIVTATNSANAITATTPITIFGAAPLANAGPDQSVHDGDKVTLDGSSSFAPPYHQPLTYFWQQIAGATVVLSNNTISRPTFFAPAGPTVLTFTLVVTDSFNLVSNPDQVRIDVLPTYRIRLPLILKSG